LKGKTIARNKVQVIKQFEQTGSAANRYDVTVITRMKSTFKYQILEESHVEQSAVNENIV
jgi:type I restriction enzyme R subunit